MGYKVYVREIIHNFSSDIVCVHGNIENQYVTKIDAQENVDRYSLDWINSVKKNKQEIAETSKALVLIVDNDIIYSEKISSERKILIVTNKPKNLLAKVANYYFIPKPSHSIHSTVIIHPEARLGKNISIGAYTVIDKCTIGDNSIIESHVRIHDNITIGSNCIIQAGVVIGTDGLGCQRENDGKLIKFPHLGGVIIGNSVEIGANCQIAKGALTNTIIEDGCKINGLCFIAHNCHINKNVWITGNTMLCGSVVIGKNTTIFSNVIIRDQVKVGENCVIGMGSVITKSVPDTEIWFGNPAQKAEK